MKVIKPIPTDFCETCAHCVPSYERLTPKPEEKPILGECEYEKYMFLLRYYRCGKYKKQVKK